MNRNPRLPTRDWESGGTDPAVVFASVLHANALLVAALRSRFADTGLAEFEVARLLWLWSEHNIAFGMHKIATKLGLSRAGASRLVDRAEEAGLVERRRGSLDARELSVRVTPVGRSAIHRFDAVLRSLVAEISLDEAELDCIDDTARRITRSALAAHAQEVAARRALGEAGRAQRVRRAGRGSG